MAQYRMQVTYLNTADTTAENHVVNTFYLDTDALSGADDPAALCNDAAALFATYRSQMQGFNAVRVRAYNMSHTPPRVPVAENTDTISGTIAPGPREVSLCLSYYAGQNTPRRRGRMFIGPWGAAAMSERPTTGQQDSLLALADGIAGLGGINVQWVQYSPTSGEFHNVTKSWVDNEWDTVRSRGLRGLVRREHSHSG